MSNLADYTIDKEENREKDNVTEIKHVVVKGKPPKGKIINTPLMQMVHETKGDITEDFDTLSENVDGRGDIDMKGVAAKGRKKFPDNW